LPPDLACKNQNVNILFTDVQHVPWQGEFEQLEARFNAEKERLVQGHVVELAGKMTVWHVCCYSFPLFTVAERRV
jgi:hypothetical protein